VASPVSQDLAAIFDVLRRTLDVEIECTRLEPPDLEGPRIHYHRGRFRCGLAYDPLPLACLRGAPDILPAPLDQPRKKQETLCSRRLPDCSRARSSYSP
jgi:hypothetical protein